MLSEMNKKDNKLKICGKQKDCTRYLNKIYITIYPTNYQLRLTVQRNFSFVIESKTPQQYDETSLDFVRMRSTSSSQLLIDEF